MVNNTNQQDKSIFRIGIDARLWDETGVGRYIRNLLRELDRLDTKNMYVIFLYKNSVDSFKEVIAQFQIRHPNWKFVYTDIRWHSFREQILFPRIIEQEKVDLMHFPYFSVPFLYNKPFVVTIHDLIINHYPTGRASTLPLPVYYLKHNAYRLLIKLISKRACKIITVSDTTRDEIIAHLVVPKDKIVVMYEGVDSHFESRRKNSVLPYTNYFLFVGNAYPHKNPELLVEAFGRIVSVYPDVTLLFVGSKNYFYDRLELKVKQRSLEKNIHFLGKVDDAMLEALYRKAHALITPSLMEGFGLPGLEAMQNKCLVLASDIPVYKEIYADAVVYFDPRSLHSIHDTILSVLQDKKKFQKYIEKGLKRVALFSWKTMAIQTIQIYESCARIRQSK